MDSQVLIIEKYFLTQKDPKMFHENVRSMSKKDIKEVFRKNYVPVPKTKEQLKQEMKHKKSWKTTKNIGGEFTPCLPLKPRVLSTWEQERVNMPQRSYENYPVSRAIKNFLPGREFGFDQNVPDATEQFKTFLKKHKEKFNHYVDRPSKYSKPQRFLPSILLDKPPFYVKHSEFGTVGFMKHNAFLCESMFRTKK